MEHYKNLFSICAWPCLFFFNRYDFSFHHFFSLFFFRWKCIEIRLSNQPIAYKSNACFFCVPFFHSVFFFVGRFLSLSCWRFGAANRNIFLYYAKYTRRIERSKTKKPVGYQYRISTCQINWIAISLLRSLEPTFAFQCSSIFHTTHFSLATFILHFSHSSIHSHFASFLSFFASMNYWMGAYNWLHLQAQFVQLNHG